MPLWKAKPSRSPRMSGMPCNSFRLLLDEFPAGSAAAKAKSGCQTTLMSLWKTSKSTWNEADARYAQLSLVRPGRPETQCDCEAACRGSGERQIPECGKCLGDGHQDQ